MISIIIPIYNLESHLANCLDSIIAQNNPDFEVIMVNDGSSDDSASICEEYEQKDSRFHLINKNNGGVSSARNLGLKFSKGDWVVFVDGDDVVDKDYLTLPKGDISTVDVIEKSYYITKNQKITLSSIINEEESMDSLDSLKRFYSKYILINSASLWNKLIRREIIGDLIFDESKVMGEDFLFFLSVFPRIKKYVRCPLGSYNYIRRESSASGVIDADYSRRIRILFENMNAVKRITKSGGIADLGNYIVYTMYLTYLLKLKQYLTCVQWYKIVSLWIKFPFLDNRLMCFSEKKNVMLGTVKSVIINS